MTSPEGRLFDALIALEHQAGVVLTAGLVGTLDGCHQGLVEHPVIDGLGTVEICGAKDCRCQPCDVGAIAKGVMTS